MHTDKPFPWGKIEEHYQVGQYHIARYVSKHDGGVCFHGWINGKDINESWPSLDEALIGMISMKHLEINHARHAATCICRMLKITDEAA